MIQFRLLEKCEKHGDVLVANSHAGVTQSRQRDLIVDAKRIFFFIYIIQPENKFVPQLS